MPPAWDPAVSAGDAVDAGTGTWYAIEVTDDIIWWARTRYGRAEACSCKPPAKDAPVVPFGQYWLPGIGLG